MKHNFKKLLISNTLCIILFPVVLLSCSGSGSSSGSSSNSAPVAQTSVGSIQGVARTYAIPQVSSNGLSSTSSYVVNEYRGIPYAQAPTGNLRWALPQPVASLGNGVFQATNFGPACPQNPRAGSPEKYVNEDCLSLNVTTPSDMQAGEKLPVFFWIHGGAFVGGSSNLYRLDKLAHDGRMVVVSTNYRLGALGFMPNAAFESNGYNGNYGLEDQRLAMKWVKDNISGFGGDNNNITIAGESAGAGSVCMHISSPNQVVSQSQVKVKDLFQKAVTQSAGCLQRLPTVAEGSVKNNAIATSLCAGSADVLACMRSKTVEEILAAQEAYTAANSTDVTAISPVTGNNTVPLAFADASAQDKLVNVPMIMGGTKSELVLYAGYFWQDSQKPVNPGYPINASTIDTIWLNAFYKNPAPVGGISAITSQYPGLLSSDSNIVAETFGLALSDFNPSLGINNCLYLHTSDTILRTSSRSNPIYQFEFADPNALVCGVGMAAPCAPFDLGPVHSSELNYFFPNLSFTSKIDAPDLSPTSQVLANQMVAYWAGFIKSGNPNQSGLPVWPQYSGKTQSYGGSSVMLLAPGSVGAYNSDNQHQCSSFWKNLYPSNL